MIGASLRFLRSIALDPRGSVAIEFAGIGIALVILTLGIFEFGSIALTKYQLSNAVGQTTRIAAMGATDQALAVAVKSKLPAYEQGQVQVTVTTREIGGGRYRRIEAIIKVPLILPKLGLFSENPYPVKAVHLIPVT